LKLLSAEPARSKNSLATLASAMGSLPPTNMPSGRVTLPASASTRACAAIAALNQPGVVVETLSVSARWAATIA
jgi:hypothetical protein